MNQLPITRSTAVLAATGLAVAALAAGLARTKDTRAPTGSSLRLRWSCRRAPCGRSARSLTWAGRKVRAPTGSMLANGEARRRDGKCNRK